MNKLQKKKQLNLENVHTHTVIPICHICGACWLVGSAAMIATVAVAS